MTLCDEIEMNYYLGETPILEAADSIHEQNLDYNFDTEI